MPEDTYFLALLHHDLFGHTVVSLYWGGIGNRLGGTKNQPVGSWEQGIEFIAELERLRAHHGYEVVASKPV